MLNQDQVKRLVVGQTVILNKRAKKHNVEARVFLVNSPNSDGGYAVVKAMIGNEYTSVTDKKYSYSTVIVVVKDTIGGKAKYIRPLNSNISLTADGEALQTILNLEPKPKGATIPPAKQEANKAPDKPFTKPEKPAIDSNKAYLTLSEIDFCKNIQISETAIKLMAVDRGVVFEHAVNKVKALMK